MTGQIFKMIHKKCRNTVYPLTKIQRFIVPDDKISWNVDFPEYSPGVYNSPVLQGKVWADPDIADASFQPQWNKLDGKVNRESYIGHYQADEDNYPLNPIGRSGLRGRGVLGRWGPNHAADPIVTRWKSNNDDSAVVDEKSKHPVLQFVGIQRKDTGEWALPGGMVDPGERVSVTLCREFMEEALNSLEKGSVELKSMKKTITDFFNQGEEVYKGYVDDPRNTDNAWMETIAFNFHDSTGKIVGIIDLQAGDDAKNVKWMDINKELSLYASHKDFIEKVAKRHNACW
ncbi:putative nudix hydrolase 6 [Copidosoma floridanum]|uniref:putative nudix hydrolase 6 n=1 Tax=Copidosoma floridanum TaxID=29053 RepID=UPI0006C9A4FC|nr:putative nudix hydrolase 6 [Copidosoma floridanum]